MPFKNILFIYIIIVKFDIVQSPEKSCEFSLHITLNSQGAQTQISILTDNVNFSFETENLCHPLFIASKASYESKIRLCYLVRRYYCGSLKTLNTISF